MDVLKVSKLLQDTQTVLGVQGAFCVTAHPSGRSEDTYHTSFVPRDGSQDRHGLYAPLAPPYLATESYMSLIELLTYLRVRCGLTYAKVPDTTNGRLRYLTWLLAPTLLLGRFAIQSAQHPETPPLLHDLSWRKLAAYLPTNHPRDRPDLLRNEPLVRTLTNEAMFDTYASAQLYDQLEHMFHADNIGITGYLLVFRSDRKLDALCRAVEATSAALVTHHDVYVYFSGIVQAKLTVMMARAFEGVLQRPKAMNDFQQMDRFSFESTLAFARAHRDATVVINSFQAQRVQVHARSGDAATRAIDNIREYYKTVYLPQATRYAEAGYALMDVIAYVLSSLRLVPSATRKAFQRVLHAMMKDLLAQELTLGSLLVLGYHHYLGRTAAALRTVPEHPRVFTEWIVARVLPVAFQGQFSMERLQTSANEVDLIALLRFATALEIRSIQMQRESVIAGLPKAMRPAYIAAYHAAVDDHIAELQTTATGETQGMASTAGVERAVDMRATMQKVLQDAYRFTMREGLEQLTTNVRCDALVVYLAHVSDMLLVHYDIAPVLADVTQGHRRRSYANSPTHASHSLYRGASTPREQENGNVMVTIAALSKRLDALDAKRDVVLESRGPADVAVVQAKAYARLPESVLTIAGFHETDPALSVEVLKKTAKAFFVGFSMISLLPLTEDEGALPWLDGAGFAPDEAEDRVQQSVYVLQEARAKIVTRRLEEGSTPLRAPRPHAPGVLDATRYLDIKDSRDAYLRSEFVTSRQPVPGMYQFTPDKFGIPLVLAKISNTDQYAYMPKKEGDKASIDVLQQLLNLRDMALEAKTMAAKDATYALEGALKAELGKFLSSDNLPPSLAEKLHVLFLAFEFLITELLYWELWIAAYLGAAAKDVVPTFFTLTQTGRAEGNATVTFAIAKALDIALDLGPSIRDTISVAGNPKRLTLAGLRDVFASLLPLLFYTDNAAERASATAGNKSAQFEMARDHHSMLLGVFKPVFTNRQPGITTPFEQNQSVDALRLVLVTLGKTMDAFATSHIITLIQQQTDVPPGPAMEGDSLHSGGLSWRLVMGLAPSVVVWLVVVSGFLLIQRFRAPFAFLDYGTQKMLETSRREFEKMLKPMIAPQFTDSYDHLVGVIWSMVTMSVVATTVASSASTATTSILGMLGLQTAATMAYKMMDMPRAMLIETLRTPAAFVFDRLSGETDGLLKKLKNAQERYLPDAPEFVTDVITTLTFSAAASMVALFTSQLPSTTTRSDAGVLNFTSIGLAGLVAMWENKWAVLLMQVAPAVGTYLSREALNWYADRDLRNSVLNHLRNTPEGKMIEVVAKYVDNMPLLESMNLNIFKSKEYVALRDDRTRGYHALHIVARLGWAALPLFADLPNGNGIAAEYNVGAVINFLGVLISVLTTYRRNTLDVLIATGTAAAVGGAWTYAT